MSQETFKKATLELSTAWWDDLTRDFFKEKFERVAAYIDDHEGAEQVFAILCRYPLSKRQNIDAMQRLMEELTENLGDAGIASDFIDMDSLEKAMGLFLNLKLGFFGNDPSRMSPERFFTIRQLTVDLMTQCGDVPPVQADMRLQRLERDLSKLATVHLGMGHS